MSSQNYIAILGRQPELGLVELESLLGPEALKPFGRQAALLSREIDVNRLGGTVKTGRVLYLGSVKPLRELPVSWDELPLAESKTPFALSVVWRQRSAGCCESGGPGDKEALA